ncbi:MAG: hypothetical protein B6D61_05970 [Bacteroidetes bacterium 4484_249]|nr:MAG: hypothetical protein B6D61_05970 [Bacteroidetes bacterium 4484_249]
MISTSSPAWMPPVLSTNINGAATKLIPVTVVRTVLMIRVSPSLTVSSPSEPLPNGFCARADMTVIASIAKNVKKFFIELNF